MLVEDPRLRGTLQACLMSCLLPQDFVAATVPTQEPVGKPKETRALTPKQICATHKSLAGQIYTSHACGNSTNSKCQQTSLHSTDRMACIKYYCEYIVIGLNMTPTISNHNFYACTLQVQRNTRFLPPPADPELNPGLML